MSQPSGLELEEEIVAVCRRGVGTPLDDERFNDLALRVFRFQCEENEAYRGFVGRRGGDPRATSKWEDIPFLPTRAFKTAVLVSGQVRRVERVFRTSGTTGGAGARGEHHVLSLSLYRESLLPNFAAHLVPDGPELLRVHCLLSHPDQVPDSSLAFMMGEVASTMGDGKSAFFLDPEGRLDGDGLARALREAERDGVPTLLAGTAFSFAQWVGMAEERGWRTRLPAGSRVMETGGYKGRSVELPRSVLYERMEKVLGVPEDRIVNEYGMTELLSQFYEPVLPGSPGFTSGREAGSADHLSRRFHRNPPWVRTLVLDPVTLRPQRAGEPGVLGHLDLANLWSVAAVLTEDLGFAVKGGFQLLGRTPGSEPRGCSLAMEDFLAVREGLG